MNKTLLALALLSAAALPTAQAQVTEIHQRVTPPPAPPDNVFFIASGAPVTPFGGAVDVVAGEGAVPGQVVKNKPYSADSVTESTQILGDGNRITHRNEARTFRDSAGRTRREQTLNALGVFQPASEPVQMVTINDPVADVSYFLDPLAKTARQLAPFKVEFGTTAARTGSAPGALPPPPPPELAGANVAVRLDRRIGPDGVAVTTETFETAPPPPPGVGVPAMRGAAVPAFGMAVAPNSTTSRTEDLGDQVLEGVVAHGTRRTERIDAGAIGNLRAIEIVSEQWYSKDIEAVVLRRNSDPRFGETVYRLINVVRSEPAAELFTVPGGYEIAKDGPMRVDTLRGPGALPPGGAAGVAGRRVFVVQPETATPAPR